MRRLQERMARLRGGRGLDGAVDMGARGAAAHDLAQRYVREAQSQGAQVSKAYRPPAPGEEGPGNPTPGSEGGGAGAETESEGGGGGDQDSGSEGRGARGLVSQV